LPTTDRPPAPPDHGLLARYAAGRDADAFAELVARHGRLVYGACLRVLRHEPDAADAFQATFLVLMRKAGTFRRNDNLPGWLHTVATRIALRARKRRAARHLLEREAAMTADAAAPRPDPAWAADLDAALAGLPAAYRLPLTLCYLEGRTGDEAAAELGWSRSTLTRRLTEGREVLRRRLERLGVAVPAAALLAVLGGAASAAEPPAAAVAALTAPGAAGVSPVAAALADGFTAGGAGLGKLSAAVLTAVAVCGLVGAGLFGGAARNEPGRPPSAAAADPPARPDPPAATPPKADPGPPAAVKPAAPAPHAPRLRDEQLISSWQWDKFRWQPVNPALTRPVAFAVTVPPGHKYVTVAVDDAKGVRVRNLLDAVEVTKLGGDPGAQQPQLLAVEWNGLNDDGRPLPDGEYRVRGCSHPGMKLVYDYSFLNPGTPPWELYPNSGWGGDHGFPHAIACLRSHGGGAWRVALGGGIAEGGSPGFVLDANGRKIHAFGRGWAGPRALAAADGHLWVGLWTGKDLLRMEYHTGKQVPFKTAKGPQPALTFDADVWGIAVGTDRVAVRLHAEKDPKKERVVVFDRETGENRVEVRFPAPTRRNGLAFRPDGKTLLVATDAGLFALDASDPAPTPRPFPLAGVEKPGPLATDAAGNLYVLDRGADYRVKVYDPAGKLVREVGTKGGQGDRLEYDPAALHGVEAISVDDDGSLWAAENGDLDTPKGRGFVRRIAVWDRAGKLARDFVGTTWYAANNTCLHEQDPTLALGYGVVYKLEPGAKPGYRPWKYLTAGQPTDAPLWHSTGAPWTLFGSVRMFRSDVSGRAREYVLQSNGFPILFQADDAGDYRPVVAIGSHEINKCFPQVKDEPKALFLWTDLNGDARPQEGEFQRLPGTTYRADIGCGYPPNRELVWYVEGLELRPVRFAPNGVPVYDAAAARRLPIPQHYIPVGRHLVAGLGGTFNSPRDGVYAVGHHLFTTPDGSPVARYRCNWPAVHASWSSTPGYKPGQTGRGIGELHYAGVVDSRSDLGHVVAMQGNYGQSFVWSGDGLFVTALFKDSRQNPKGWGAKEEFGADWTDITMMGECFGGMMCRQDDGKVRYLFGRNGCHVVRVEGLEAVRRFDAGTVELKGPTAGGTAAPKADPPDRVLRVPDVTGRFPAFKADGDPAEWKGIPRLEVRVGDDVVARVAVAHTRQHLWVLAEVDDPSPWRNAGADPKLAFKTGDAIDLFLGTDREPRPKGHLTLIPKGDFAAPRVDRTAPAAGDLRVLIAPAAKGKAPVVTAYRPVSPEAKPEEAFPFESPVRRLRFDSVAPVPDTQVAARETKTGYVVEVRLPCERIDLRDAGRGLRVRGDLGVLWGNEAGLGTERRAYLFNRGPAAAVVSDTPTEAELHPAEWGVWVFE